jgi:hypothetical protein
MEWSDKARARTNDQTRRLGATRRRLRLTLAVILEQDHRMTFVRVLGRLFVISALMLCGGRAVGESSFSGEPLIQAQFTRLVPITYPLATTRFTALRPTSFPVIQPGVARVHIIQKLVHPMSQPLLRTF